jgi:hypothetical protein
METTMITIAFRGRWTLAAAAALGLAGLSGCGAYNPAGLSAMSAVDLCELEYRQGRNLSPAAKQTIQSELQRRNDNCRNHSAAVAERFAEFMYRETYGKIDNP